MQEDSAFSRLSCACSTGDWKARRAVRAQARARSVCGLRRARRASRRVAAERSGCASCALGVESDRAVRWRRAPLCVIGSDSPSLREARNFFALSLSDSSFLFRRGEKVCEAVAKDRA